MVQVPEDGNEDFIWDPGDVYGFCFFFAFECEGFWEALDDLGDGALWDGTRVMRFLRYV